MRKLPWWILAAALVGPACEMRRDGVPEAPRVDEPSPADNRVTPEQRTSPQEEPFQPDRLVDPESSWSPLGVAKDTLLAQARVTGPVEPVPPERPAPAQPGPAIGGSGEPIIREELLEFQEPIDLDIAFGPSEDPPLAADPVPVRKNFAPELADEGLAR